jgi:hypothetical protein
MRIFDIRSSFDNGAASLTARVLPKDADAPLELWCRAEGCGGPLGGLGDALAVGLLTPAMFEREALIVDAPLSKPLLDNLARAQEILSCWFDYLSAIAVSASGIDDQICATPSGMGVGCFFTGGVDSWYSLLKNEPRITHLVLVRGFDIGLDNEALWRKTHATVAFVAQRLGKRLIACETNLREIADKRRALWGRRHDGDFWGQCLHGAALASVGLMLRHDINEMIIGATHSYRQIRPWGSSPLLDPLWSSGPVRVMHDGCEAGRIEKTRAIAQCDLALETLRVCYHDSGAYNCGRCEKCVRTMLALRTCGALDRARTFPEGLSLSRVRQMLVPDHVRYHYDLLIAAGRRFGDDQLVRAVQAATGQRVSLPHCLALVKRAVRKSPVGGPLRTLLGSRPPAAHEARGHAQPAAAKVTRPVEPEPR